MSASPSDVTPLSLSLPDPVELIRQGGLVPHRPDDDNLSWWEELDEMPSAAVPVPGVPKRRRRGRGIVVGALPPAVPGGAATTPLEAGGVAPGAPVVPFERAPGREPFVQPAPMARPGLAARPHLPRLVRAERRRGAGEIVRGAAIRLAAALVLLAVGAAGMASFSRSMLAAQIGLVPPIVLAEQAWAEGRHADAARLATLADGTGEQGAAVHLMRARIAVHQGLPSLARVEATRAAAVSGDWVTDLALARLLASVGETERSADLSLRAFIRGAGADYLPEIVRAQIAVGRGAEAERLVAFGRVMDVGELRRSVEGMSRTR